MTELTKNNLKSNIKVIDNNGYIGTIISTNKDIHNIEVEYSHDSGFGIYCIDKKCDDYDPLYFL